MDLFQITEDNHTYVSPHINIDLSNVSSFSVKRYFYTKKCSRDESGRKLNQYGLKMYTNYKKKCDIEPRSCRDVTSYQEAINLSERFKECGTAREEFNTHCSASVDSGHIGAILSTKEKKKECEEKVKELLANIDFKPSK
jgi:hypothetical protein